MRIKGWRLPAVAIVVALLAAGPSFARGFSAKISKVKDGESLVVSQKGRRVDVELAGIHAPSLSHELGRQARDLLAQIAHQRQARIEIVREGMNGALIARVEVEGQDLATALIRAGLARPTTEATTEQIAAADAARAAELGLWAEVASSSSLRNDA